MQGTMIVIEPVGTVEFIPCQQVPTLELLQEKVGGPLELLPYFIDFMYNGALTKCAALVDEEGMFRDPVLVNHLATDLWAASLVRNGIIQPEHDGTIRMSDFVKGTCVVLVGDDEFMSQL